MCHLSLLHATILGSSLEFLGDSECGQFCERSMLLLVLLLGLSNHVNYEMRKAIRVNL
jgi:hypothetical protein